MNITIGIIIPILTAVIGGWIGAYFGHKYTKRQNSEENEKLRNIAIKALNIIKSYQKHSYSEAENEFNKSMSISEKRTVIVALHKLGIPIGLSSNEKFDIKKIHFVDSIIDEDDIDGIILQINKGFCDNLFYIDPDSYFAANYTLFAKRNTGKRYVSEMLSNSKVDYSKNILTEPMPLDKVFSLGEIKSIQVFREVVRDQNYFDENGKPIQKKINTLLKEIDLGLWDNYLLWSFEAYQNIMLQNKFADFLSQSNFNNPNNSQHSK